MRAEGRKGWAGSKQIRNARTRPRLGAGAALLQREPLPHSGVWERGSPGPRAPTPHRAQHRGTRPRPTSMRPPSQGRPGHAGLRTPWKGEGSGARGGWREIQEQQSWSPPPRRKRGDTPGLAPGPSPEGPCQPRGRFRVGRRHTKQAAAQARTSDSPCGTRRATLAPRPPGPLALEGRASPQPGRAATAQNASARAAGPRAALLEPAEALADLPLARGKRFPSRQVARGLQPRHAGADLGFVSMTH